MTFNFNDIADLTNIDITSITLSFTVGNVGGTYTKYLYLRYGSASGTSVGNYSFSSCYNTNKSITFSATKNASGFTKLKSYIEGISSNTTVVLGIYNSGSSRGSSSGKSFDYDYMNITAASMTLTYSYMKSTGSIEPAQTGSNATLTITPYNASYTHKTTWILGEHQSEPQTVDAGDTTSSFTIPNNWLPNSTSGTATVILETFSGETSLGTNSYDFEVTVPSSVVPTIGSFATTLVNAGASETAVGWGLYIQNRSKVQASLSNVSAGDGATIATYSIITSPNVGSLSSSTDTSFTSDLLSIPGDVEFTVTVTDSRGRTASITPKPKITVIAYNPPSFGLSSLYRCNDQGVRDDTGGQYAKLMIGFAYSFVESGGTVYNSPVVHKATVNNKDYSVDNLVEKFIGDADGTYLSTDQTYDVVITITDAVGSTSTYTMSLPSAKYIIHIQKGGRSVGFFSAALSNVTDTVYIGGDLVLKNALPVSSGGTGADNSSDACTNIGAVKKSGDSMTGWLTIDTSTATTSADERGIDLKMPSDNHFKVYSQYDGGRIWIIRTTSTNPWDEIANINLSNNTLEIKKIHITNSLALSNPIQARTAIGSALGEYTPSTRLDTGCGWNGKRVYRYCLTGTLTGTTTGDINIGALPDTPTMIVAITGSYRDDSGSTQDYWRPIGFTSYYQLSSNPNLFTAFVKANNDVNLVIGSGLTGNKTYCVNIDYTID